MHGSSVTASRYTRLVDREGFVSGDLEIVSVAEVEALLAAGTPVFSEGETAFAFATSDPARRLAARLAAKRAAIRLLGPGVGLCDVEIDRRAGGSPVLVLSPRASAALERLGANRCLVSLTHERRHAAASVVLLST